MNYDIASIGRVGEYRVCLDDLFRESVVESLKQERAKTRACAASNRVQHHKSLEMSGLALETCRNQETFAYLEGITAISFTIYHFHDVFMYRLASLITVTPIVCCTDTIFAHVEVLWVVDILVWSCLYSIDDLETVSVSIAALLRFIPVTYSGFEIDQDGPRNVSSVVALVEEDVFAVAALGREVLQVSVLADAMLLAELLPELAANWVKSVL